MTQTSSGKRQNTDSDCAILANIIAAMNQNNPPTGARVLVADDEPLVRRSIKLLLELKGYGVETAQNATEALALCEKTEFQVGVLDYEMPEMKGIELASNLKIIRPQMPILMVTAYAEDLRNRLDSLSVDALLSKPFDTTEFLATIAELTASSPPSPANPASEQGAAECLTGTSSFRSF